MKAQVLEANRRLATALGWANIIDAGGALMGSPPWAIPHARGQMLVPNWAGDWKECGPLMVENWISTEQTGTTARAAKESSSIRVKVEDEAERGAKTRYAIVQVLCNRLELKAKLEAAK